MLLNETSFQDVIPIQGYGKNNFKIDDKFYKGGIFIFSNTIWLKIKSVVSLFLSYINKMKIHDTVKGNLFIHISI